MAWRIRFCTSTLLSQPTILSRSITASIASARLAVGSGSGHVLRVRLLFRAVPPYMVRALAKAFLAMALDRAERLNGAVPVEIAA